MAGFRERGVETGSARWRVGVRLCEQKWGQAPGACLRAAVGAVGRRGLQGRPGPVPERAPVHRARTHVAPAKGHKQLLVISSDL